MRNLLIFGAFAAVASAPAFAQDATILGPGNVALTTDYAFRGITQTDGTPRSRAASTPPSARSTPAPGLRTSTSAPAARLELDVYGGYKFAAGPVAIDVGVIGYLYPGAADDGLAQHGRARLLRRLCEALVRAGRRIHARRRLLLLAGIHRRDGRRPITQVNAGYTVSPAFSSALLACRTSRTSRLFAGRLATATRPGTPAAPTPPGASASTCAMSAPDRLERRHRDQRLHQRAKPTTASSSRSRRPCRPNDLG